MSPVNLSSYTEFNYVGTALYSRHARATPVFIAT